MENARSGLRRFIPYLRRHRRALALILLLSIAVAFIVLLPVQIISAAVDDLSGASARSSFSVWIGLAGGRPLAYPCLFFIFYALSQAASTFYGDRVMRLSYRMIEELRADAFGWIVRRRPFADELREGDVIARLTGDIEAVNSVVSGPLNGLILSLLQVIWALGIFALWNPLLALAATLALPGLYAVSVWAAKRSAVIAGESRKADAALVVGISGVLDSLPLVRAYQKEKYEEGRFAGPNRRVTQLKGEGQRLYVRYQAGIQLFSLIGYTLVLFVTIRMALEGRLSPGAVLTAFVYAQNIYRPITQITQYVNSLAAADAALTRVFALKERVMEASGPCVQGGDVACEDVSIRCNEEYTLSGVSFTARAGTLTALTGPSGAGKSTLLYALMGFKEIASGRMHAGESIRYAAQFQSAYLFDRSLLENVAYGEDRPDRERALGCLRAVGLERLCAQRGLDSLLGTQGKTLSGGEQRRVALARMLYREADVYLMDEPTAELDEHSAQEIRNLILRLRARSTLIASTHDEALIRAADHVVKL